MRTQGTRRGVLVVNLGTPDDPGVSAVRRYLRAFLSDPRVIDLPALPRWLLVNGIVAPFRAPRSAHAYRAIWTDAGSPLRVYSEQLVAALSERLGERVVLAMRYGSPSIAEGIARLGEVDRILVAPLYPQYASSTTGSVLEAVYRALADRAWVPPVEVLPPFHALPGFLDAQARLARSAVVGAEHVLFSYHGLPVRQVRAAAPSCRLDACCEAVPPWCYRAQCLATSRALASRLALPDGGWTTAFQSRFGADAWLGPATDAVVDELAGRGVKRLAVICPSFATDCLETLEEIGMRAAERFAAGGGEALRLVPCVNAEPDWVAALAQALGRG